MLSQADARNLRTQRGGTGGSQQRRRDPDAENQPERDEEDTKQFVVWAARQGKSYQDSEDF